LRAEKASYISDELVDEHAERPAVTDDLVQGEEQQVFPLG